MECLLRDPFLQTQLELVCLEPTQRALVWKRGRLASVAGPGQHAFWAEPDGVIVEVHDIREARLVHPRLDEVARLTERSGMKHRRLELVHDDEVMNWLMRHGFDPELGARHLCHAIHRDVSAAIARVLLAGDGGSDSAVRLSVRGDELHAELVRCMHGVASADVIPARR